LVKHGVVKKSRREKKIRGRAERKEQSRGNESFQKTSRTVRGENVRPNRRSGHKAQKRLRNRQIESSRGFSLWRRVYGGKNSSLLGRCGEREKGHLRF